MDSPDLPPEYQAGLRDTGDVAEVPETARLSEDDPAEYPVEVEDLSDAPEGDEPEFLGED